MFPHRSLDAPGNVDDLISRLGLLKPVSERRWGTLSAHEMLCHLADAFSAVLGDLDASPADTWFSRTIMKWGALHTPVPWPHGVSTRPELDPLREGTKPASFNADRERVLDLLRRFVRPETQCLRHPAFGPMTREEWLLWGYGHVDHHLRQFGL